MDESNVRLNSPKAWLLAARPKTLTGAAVPVMIGAALAWRHAGGTVEWLPCVLCFLFAFVMQIDANLVNDYFDYKRGNDDADSRLGPLRACSMGWVTPQAMRKAIAATTILGCAVGLPLAIVAGWWLIAIGVACVLGCFLYTTRLSYLGLGDVLVLVFFGLVAVCFTYLLCLPAPLRAMSSEVVGVALACGLAVDTLLLINNYRDMDNDRRDGKRTLVVMVGHRWGQRLYFLSGTLAAGLAGILLLLHQHALAAMLLVFVYEPLHLRTYRLMLQIDHGRALNRVLGKTARNILIFGLCIAVGTIAM